MTDLELFVYCKKLAVDGMPRIKNKHLIRLYEIANVKHDLSKVDPEYEHVTYRMYLLKDIKKAERAKLELMSIE